MLNRIQFSKLILELFLLFSIPLKGQEFRPLYENQVIKRFITEDKKQVKSVRTVALPANEFFDDFSKITVFPDESKWQDKCAFVNATFAVEPITYGVITLDAIDENGDVYNIGGTPTLCDSLTSIPMDLSIEADKTYYLSFFYQPQGLGEAPESQDSLTLRFFNPSANNWYSVWRAGGSSLRSFDTVIIRIPANYNQNGFKFQFRNYASFTANELVGGEGALSNLDLWHLDYVRLNNNDSIEHTKVYDISIINPLSSSFKSYQLMPWDHVPYAISQDDRRNYMPLGIRMNDRPEDNPEETGNVDRYIYIKDLENNQILSITDGRNNNLEYDSINWFQDIYYANIGASDSGRIEIGAYLNYTSTNFAGNDTITRKEIYKDYYAYDDGTAELGFGQSGESMTGTLLVQKFKIFKPDSLKAVDIYFNKTKDNFTGNLEFNLCIWNDNGGIPGDTLFVSDSIFKPDTLNTYRYTRYRFKYPVYVSGDIYVGIIQQTDEFLNIGYDLNNPNKDKIFYNTTGTWKKLGISQPDGSLMIRPALNYTAGYTGIDEIDLKSSPIQVFPNPVSDYLQFRSPVLPGTQYTIRIIDALGNILYSELNNEDYVDVSNLTEGFYIIQVISSGGTLYTGKFLKHN